MPSGRRRSVSLFEPLKFQVNEKGRTGYPSDQVQREESVGVPAPVLDLVSVVGLDLSSRSGVDDEKKRDDEGKDDNSVGQDRSGGEALHEGGDHDGSDDLHGLVETRQRTELGEGRASAETVGGEGDDGSVEGLWREGREKSKSVERRGVRRATKWAHQDRACTEKGNTKNVSAHFPLFKDCWQCAQA
jgi:hypothetical protein